MIRRNAFALAALALAAPLASQATDRLSYSYLDANYVNSKLTVTDTNPAGATTKGKDDAEGFGAGVGVSLMPYVYFAADYDQRLFHSTRWSYGSAGFGAHTMDPAYQFFGAVTYERSVLHPRNDQAGSDNASDDGYGLQAGVRVPWDIFEVHAAYKYVNLGKNQAGTHKLTGDRFGGGIMVHLTPWWAITGDWRRVDEKFKPEDPTVDHLSKDQFSEWTVGFRRYFATDVDKYKRHAGIFGRDEAANP